MKKKTEFQGGWVTYDANGKEVIVKDPPPDKLAKIMQMFQNLLNAG